LGQVMENYVKLFLKQVRDAVLDPQFASHHVSFLSCSVKVFSTFIIGYITTKNIPDSDHIRTAGDVVR